VETSKSFILANLLALVKVWEVTGCCHWRRMSQPLCTVGSDLVQYSFLFSIGAGGEGWFPEVFVFSLLAGVYTNTPEVLKLKI